MRMIIEVNMDNAAFQGDDGSSAELARIIELQAKRILYGTYDLRSGSHNSIHDINGNAVGQIKFI